MCSSFTADCGHENSTILLIEDVYCPNTKCSGKLRLHKKTFQSLGRSDYQCPQCVCVPSAQWSLWRSNNFLFLVLWPRGSHLWRESKINWRCYCRRVFSWQVLFQQREMRISWRFCNNSEIHLWLWKIWSLVDCSKSSFYLTRARKDDKNRQRTLFPCWKNMNVLPDKQLFINVPFQSTKYRKKELRMVSKVQETIGYVYGPTSRIEKCVYISTNKKSSFYDCKKCKACCHVLNFHFVDQKRTVILFGGGGTPCFARKTSRDYEKEKPSPF